MVTSQQVHLKGKSNMELVGDLSFGTYIIYLVFNPCRSVSANTGYIMYTLCVAIKENDGPLYCTCAPCIKDSPLRPLSQSALTQSSIWATKRHTTRWNANFNQSNLQKNQCSLKSSLARLLKPTLNKLLFMSLAYEQGQERNNVTPAFEVQAEK